MRQRIVDRGILLEFGRQSVPDKQVDDSVTRRRGHVSLLDHRVL